MKQRVITVFTDFKPNSIVNLDDCMDEITVNSKYVIKQIVSTSMEVVNSMASVKKNHHSLAITLLLEENL